MQATMKKRKMSKSQRVRDAMAELPPDAPAKDVVKHARLPEKYTQYVYNFRRHQRAKGTGGKNTGKRRSMKVASQVLVADLLTLNPVVQKMGGVDRAREAMDALEQLQAS